MEKILMNIPSLDETEATFIEQSQLHGRKSIRAPIRHQLEVKVACIDDLITPDHRVRGVWDYVSKLDMSPFLDDIKIKEGCKGPRTADPKVLLAIWLYGILEGYASSRHLDRLCKEHHAYIWICGNVTVNYHTLSAFRTKHLDKFRSLLQESIAIMWQSGLFAPDTVAQDGTRVKASAGGNSFRRQAKLEKLLEQAKTHLETLENELAANPTASSQREKAAKTRAAQERIERLNLAQSEMKKYKEERKQSSKKNHHSLSQKDIDDMRTSTTDPECRKMKMGDGGYRPAYNVQFATSVDKKVILGVDVVNTLDPGTLAPMMRDVTRVLEDIGCPLPENWLADSGYANKDDSEEAKTEYPEITLYSPPKGNKKADALTPRKTDNEAMKELRTRMGTEEAKEIYKDRSSTAEFVNATSKNRGMTEFLVRGLDKVKNMACLYAIAHNMMMYFNN